MGEFPPDPAFTGGNPKKAGRPKSAEPRRMDIRPVRRQDLDSAILRSQDQDMPLTAGAAIGQEPYTLGQNPESTLGVVPHSPEHLESQLEGSKGTGMPDSAVATNEPYTFANKEESTSFKPSEAPGFNQKISSPEPAPNNKHDINTEDEGVPFFIKSEDKPKDDTIKNKEDGYRKIGESVSKRTDELEGQGMDEGSAHAKALDEFWREIDPDTKGSIKTIEDGYRKIGEAVSKRIDELKAEGMSDSDAHARAHDEFWRVEDSTPPPGPPVPPPGPPGKEDGPIKLYALDTTETDSVEASRRAAIRLESEIRDVREKLFSPKNPKPGRFAKLVNIITMPIKAVAHPKEFFTYLAKSSVGKDYYLQKYKAESVSGMDDFDYHSAVARDVAARFDSAEYVLQNGERKLAQDNPEVRDVKDRLNEVFRAGITGTMDRDTVLTESRRIVASAPWLQANSEESIHLVQNLEETYDRITTAVDHEAGLASIDAAYELVGGEVTLGVNAEVHKTATDRIMEKLTNSPLKALIVNEATVGMAVGAVVGAIGFIAKSKGVKVGVAAVIGGPVAMVATAGAAGLFAYGREKMRMRQDRALHMAERAMGGNGPDENEKDTPRRIEMEGVIYEMASSRDILSSYEGLIPEDISTMTDEDARSLQAWLIALRTNQTVGDENNIDLIQYSSEDSVESEKTQLFEARARANVALRQYTAQHPDFMAQIPGESYDAKLDFLVNAQTEQLMQGEIANKDRAFRSLSRNRAAKRAAATAAFSLAGSYIGHQITEHFVDHGVVAPRDPGIMANQRTLLSMRGDSVDMPKGWSIRGNTLLDAEGHSVITDYQYNPDGSLSQHTIHSLQAKGFRFNETLTTKTVVTTREVPYDEYARLHPEKFAPVHREAWMGNDTPMYRDANGVLRGADLNELRGDFNLAPNGDIVLDTARMTNDGSFWGMLKVAAHSDQLDGKLRWLFTPDKNHQGSSMVLEVDAGGKAIIPKDSDIYKLFSVSQEGNVTLDSGFAEVAVPTGRSTNGAYNFFILATQEGNKPPGMMTITETTDIPAFHGAIVVPNAPDPVIDPYVPFIPISGVFPRKPLEEIIPGGYVEPYITSPYNGYQSGEFSPEEEEKRKKAFSERLRNNPDAVLDPRTEIEDYISRMDHERREGLAKMTDEAEPMAESVKIVVGIPVNGSQEGKNIYKTLQWYSGQVDADGKPLDTGSYEIVLYVNKPTDRDWDDTLNEIQRFKADHPDMPIRVIQKEYEPSQARIGRIRRDMTDLTLARQARRSSGEDLVIVSNDADCKGLGESYIATIMEQVGAQSVDGLSGRLEWDPTTNTESPLYHMGVKFMQMLDVIDRHPLPGSGRGPRYRYPGANFAFRSSMYAAVGGYDAGSTKAEDVVLGKSIKLARTGSSKFKGIGFYGGDNVVYTDSRRGVFAFNQGYPPSMQWSKLSFGASDEAREGVELEDSIRYDILLDENPIGINAVRQRRARAKFESELARFLEQTLEEYAIVSNETEYHDGMKLPKDVEMALRAIKALRIDADIDVTGGDIRINIEDSSRLYEYLRNYQTSGLRNYSARTGIDRVFSGGLKEVFPDLETS